MIKTKRYDLVNDLTGWACFVIAAVTYLLTIEPTASFWDCPEFISQGAKLEVGHPPGNPIFMLAARFFVTLFGGIANAAVAVNCMSALLSAGTILLLCWTVTALARRLVMPEDAPETHTLPRLVTVMVCGVCGALAYCWSDTFWFSAVEGEVYAFSSFCTALVFWLILKWERRVDQPHSDRYLVLIAYVIGISIAVHLLNLLCIPAIGLVFYFRQRAGRVTAKGALAALLVSCVIVGLILFGLVPGFMTVAQRFELFFVNTCGLSYNVGVLLYAVVLTGVSIYTIRALYAQQSAVAIKAGVFFTILLSGMPFIGHSWIIPAVLVVALAVYLAAFCRRIPVRVFTVAILSVFVIFIGYSSYALLLIRASAGTPMNQNSPADVFALASYMSREQYGDVPLLYGNTYADELQTVQDPQTGETYVVTTEQGYPQVRATSPYLRDASGGVVDDGTDTYAQVVKKTPDEPDRYVKEVHKVSYQTIPGLKVPFSRIFSSDPTHVENYKSWADVQDDYFAPIPDDVRQRWAQQMYVPYMEVAPYLKGLEAVDTRLNEDGSMGSPVMMWRPSYTTNLRYFTTYQLNHMYWRYFMWNFAGRQNDMAGNGEPHLGNWITGIPALDNARLGDQSLLPDEFGKGNKGHNVYYMLPLLLGLLGALWQALARHRSAGDNAGIEQFWVIFFLFFMTGVAIVLYLNQTPGQPRERDYAFAGSFYAFAIWIGLGVAALVQWLRMALAAMAGKQKDKADGKTYDWGAVAVGAAVAVLIPLQMVSQTWDDHDRTGRYAARDFGANYLESVDQDGIIFTYGDNDTFPLWYAQEVEGIRRDVRVINLSYLTTDWYANQMRHPAYEGKGVPMYAQPDDYGYDRMGWNFVHPNASTEPVDAQQGLKSYYGLVGVESNASPDDYDRMMRNTSFVIPIDKEAAAARYGTAAYPDSLNPAMAYPQDITFSLGGPGSGFSLNKILNADIATNNFTTGFSRPVYYAISVPGSQYSVFAPWLHSSGMALEVTPYNRSVAGINADKAYANIMGKFRWGGLDNADRSFYVDETIARMVASVRAGILGAAQELIKTGTRPASQWAVDYAKEHHQPVPADHYAMARNLLQLMEAKMPADVAPLDTSSSLDLAECYYELYAATGDKADLASAERVSRRELERYAQFAAYAGTLSPYWLSRLTSADTYNLHALAGLLAIANRISLRQAVDSGRAGEDTELYRKALDGADRDDLAYYVGRWLYIMDMTPEEMEQVYRYADPEFRKVVETAAAFKQMHQDLGVDPMAMSKELASRHHTDMKTLQRVYQAKIR